MNKADIIIGELNSSKIRVIKDEGKIEIMESNNVIQDKSNLRKVYRRIINNNLENSMQEQEALLVDYKIKEYILEEITEHPKNTLTEDDLEKLKNELTAVKKEIEIIQAKQKDLRAVKMVFSN